MSRDAHKTKAHGAHGNPTVHSHSWDLYEVDPPVYKLANNIIEQVNALESLQTPIN